MNARKNKLRTYKLFLEFLEADTTCNLMCRLYAQKTYNTQIITP